MIKSGTYELFNEGLTSAATVISDSLDGIAGCQALSISTRFAYGSGGSTVLARLQTTLDGSNWLDVARFDFATASSLKTANITFMASEAIGAYAALSAEGLNECCIGDKLRVQVVSTGTYINTELRIDVSLR